MSEFYKGLVTKLNSLQDECRQIACHHLTKLATLPAWQALEHAR
jgi:hypothetical protein